MIQRYQSCHKIKINLLTSKYQDVIKQFNQLACVFCNKRIWVVGQYFYAGCKNCEWAIYFDAIAQVTRFGTIEYVSGSISSTRIQNFDLSLNNIKLNTDLPSDTTLQDILNHTLRVMKIQGIKAKAKQFSAQ